MDRLHRGRPLVAPAGEESAFAEKIIRLPHSYSPTDDRLALGAAPPRAALGLPEEGLVFSE